MLNAIVETCDLLRIKNRINYTGCDRAILILILGCQALAAPLCVNRSICGMPKGDA